MAEYPASAPVAPSAQDAEFARAADVRADGAAKVAHRFVFRGAAGEYFRIWMVNVALTALTLGVFSAWAKVRTQRYFYAHTFLEGANFEYHARPLSILVARIIVFAVVIGGGFWADIYAIPFLYTLLLAVFLPWAAARGLSFNARNSSHRNIKFAFRRAYGKPYLFYLLLITGVGLFALPWIARGWHAFKAERHQLGAMRFAFHKPSIFPYIFALWVAPASAAAMLVSLGAVFAEDNGMFFALSAAAAYIAMVFLFFFAQAALFLTFWRAVRGAGGAEMQCDFLSLQFASLLFVNFCASLLSLGLLHPWAKVRRTRFLTERMRVVAPPGALDEIFARRGEKENALGEEFAASEGFDFDAGLV